MPFLNQIKLVPLKCFSQKTLETFAGLTQKAKQAV
jgi:hypothetical protein